MTDPHRIEARLYNQQAAAKGTMVKTVMNFRDSGGYPAIDGRRLREGLLYRSGTLDKVRGADLAAIRSLGLKTLVDLRSPEERGKRSHPPLAAHDVALPLAFDSIARERMTPLLLKRDAESGLVDALDSVYQDMVDQSFTQLRALFQILLSADTYPLLVHCRMGRDRTGFVCAVIQLALGIEPPAIVQDYLKSNLFLLPKAERPLQLLGALTLGLFPTENLRTAFTAQERYIRTILDKIDHDYGGIARYLGRCGVAQRELEALKGLLLA